MKEEFDLSKKGNWVFDFDKIERNVYKEEDVKEFLKRLKENIMKRGFTLNMNLNIAIKNQLLEIIDSLSGKLKNNNQSRKRIK